MNRSIHIQLEPYHSGYLPTVIASRFWTLKKNYIQLNDTVTTVPLKIWFNSYRECIQVAMPAVVWGLRWVPSARWKIEYQDNWDMAVETHENMGTLSDTDMDDVKVGRGVVASPTLAF
jgi:hypothetical protein